MGGEFDQSSATVECLVPYYFYSLSTPAYIIPWSHSAPLSPVPPFTVITIVIISFFFSGLSRRIPQSHWTPAAIKAADTAPVFNIHASLLHRHTVFSQPRALPQRNRQHHSEWRFTLRSQSFGEEKKNPKLFPKPFYLPIFCYNGTNLPFP